MPRFYIKTHTATGASGFTVIARDHADALEQADRITRDKIVDVRVENRFDPFLYYAGRMFIRTLRIGSGIALVVAAWLVFDSNDISDKPMSALTLGDLAGLAFRCLFGFVLAAGGWECAFGAAPERDRSA